MTGCKTIAKVALFMAAIMVACPCVVGQRDLSVSLIRLIANPEKYDGQVVIVIGFLRLEYEGNAIYLHEDDFKNQILENSVRIGITKETKHEFEGKNMHYVLVTGTFKAAQSGTSLLNGYITDVTRVVLWPPKQLSSPD